MWETVPPFRKREIPRLSYYSFEQSPVETLGYHSNEFRNAGLRDGKHPYFGDALKSNDNSRRSSQSIFVNDPPTHHHPTHKDSDSLFFTSNALIMEIRMLT